MDRIPTSACLPKNTDKRNLQVHTYKFVHNASQKHANIFILSLKCKSVNYFRY